MEQKNDRGEKMPTLYILELKLKSTRTVFGFHFASCHASMMHHFVFILSNPSLLYPAVRHALTRFLTATPEAS
jgi:hypothetical protein